MAEQMDLAAIIANAPRLTVTRLGAGDSIPVVSLTTAQQAALWRVLSALEEWRDLKERIMRGEEEIGEFYRTAWNGIDGLTYRPKDTTKADRP